MAKGVKSTIDYSGASALLINVECHITNGLPAVIIIGYASKAVDEAKERLRASFANSSITFPKKRITINLSPADVPKDATSLDLAMAVAIMQESELVKPAGAKKFFMGELSLDGSLNPVHGIIGRILEAKRRGGEIFYIPEANLDQAMLMPGVEIKPARNLRDVYLDLSGSLQIKSISSGQGHFPPPEQAGEFIDLSEVAGQPIAKRALEIAAAGHHNLLFQGPPGTGKTMLAKAMYGLLPPLEKIEILEVTQLHSLSGGSRGQIITSRPFRSPHHTASTIALVGGGATPKPGEASLAHRGVLFLDELPEFSRGSLEALRQPLEDGYVTVARIKDSARYPANFILVATQNPCPCGYWGTSKPCKCSASSIEKYQKKISGPILDRIDMHLAVNEVDHQAILDKKARPSETDPAKTRVKKAYQIQSSRFGGHMFNSSMTNKQIRELAKLSENAKSLIDNAAKKLDVSARAYIRTVKVARTIADLDNKPAIEVEHISEALQYRHLPTTP